MELDITKSNHVEVKVLKDSVYEIKTTGNDPFIYTKPLKTAYDPYKEFVLSFEYLCMKGIKGVQLFYGPPIKEAQSAHGPDILSSEGWTSYAMNIITTQKKGSWRAGYKEFRIDFGRAAGRTIQLRNIQLRAPNAAELRAAQNAAKDKMATATFDAGLKAMVAARHKASIAGITAMTDKLRVSVEVPKEASDLFLCEVPFYQSMVNRTEFVWKVPVPQGTAKQVITVDRVRDNHNRVFSSWVLMERTEEGLVPASHQRFTDTMPAKWELTQDRPKNRKGTVGMYGGNAIQIADYKAMQIHSATKNIVLPALVSDKPRKGFSEHKFNGTTVHINPGYLKGLDRSMIEMHKHKVVVSGIILIPKGHKMGHPDCAPQGIYAMANVVEKEGWNIYAAGLDFLAQRYMRKDRKYGRMTHWILHNEVDAAWVWTNAGEKPLHTYLDLHYRSMRTAQSVIRRYGSAGQVLVSLTHYWTKAHNSKCYKPKDMIDLLAKRSALEGEFDWGLAYHPYPQNLRDPRTWLDKQATYDFDTKVITPKNLEVLDAYMRQKHMLYGGKVRTIVLSEQGMNSPDHSVTSYRNQAAALAYTWYKMEQLGSIESFVHHQWMDHPKEGGLNLGLRRRPQTSNTAAKKATATVCAEMEKFGITCKPDDTMKPAREIFRILDTPERHKAYKYAASVIGVKDISELLYRGEIKGKKK